MAKKEFDDRSNWLQALYTEAWKLYSHEEVMSQTRNTFFLSSHGAMLAILTGISSVLIKMHPSAINSKSIYPGIILLGAFAIVIGIAGIIINKYWKNINRAHQSYQNVRWLTTRAIEWEANISDIGLASIEHRWRKHRKLSDENFHPFEDIPELKEHFIESKKKYFGYNSINGVVVSINFLWGLVIFCGICSIISGFLFTSIFK